MLMIRQISYALLTLALLALAAAFGLQKISRRSQSLPTAQLPAELAGRPCEHVLDKARELTKSAPGRARPVYLWMLSHCDGSPVLPGIMLEAGSLFGHLLHQPREAQEVYEDFLRRFPNHPQADDATYHLAKLEIDAGDYTAAVAHLTALAERYPNSPHQESAKFLASKAAETLAGKRHAFWTLSGQASSMIPNNPFSFVILLIAVGPVVIDWVGRAKRERRWLLPSIVIALTLLNYVINNFEAIQRNAQLVERFVRLAAPGV
jgi:tetratricopeptide (TPR) repeat protein